MVMLHSTVACNAAAVGTFCVMHVTRSALHDDKPSCHKLLTGVTVYVLHGAYNTAIATPASHEHGQFWMVDSLDACPHASCLLTHRSLLGKHSTAQYPFAAMQLRTQASH